MQICIFYSFFRFEELLENQFKEKSSEYEVRIQQLEEQLKTSTEKFDKMKKQFQMKLKAVRDDKAKETSSSSSSPCPESEVNVPLNNIRLLNFCNIFKFLYRLSCKEKSLVLKIELQN